MKSVRLLRTGAMFFAFVSIVGGYALHQYVVFVGPEALAQWSISIAGPNLALGWTLAFLALVLGFLPGDGGDEP